MFKNRLLWICTGVTMLLIIAAGVAFGVARYHWKWAAIAMPEATAKVVEEMPPARLGELLQDNGKLHDVAAFEQAARKIGLTTVRPGVYELPPFASPTQLVQIFAKPPTLVKVTFPEGWTAHRMAERLEAKGIAAADEFRQLAYPPNQQVSPWEGRLFPDTYLVPRQASAKDIIQILHTHYQKVTKELPRPFPQWSPGKVLSLAQLTTLASIVQRETALPDERAIVAGVLLNRLRRGMRLQCDATVQYARELAQARGKLENGHKERLLYSDLEIESPYNTYRHGGLPPGPISNPGKASLLAAARPKASEYLFYVWSPRQERHLFAKTYDQHLHNIRVVRKER